MTHVLQVLFLSVFILQVVMHGEESHVPRDLRQSEILIEQDLYVFYKTWNNYLTTIKIYLHNSNVFYLLLLSPGQPLLHPIVIVIFPGKFNSIEMI
jgi:hypothetical protein